MPRLRQPVQREEPPAPVREIIAGPDEVLPEDQETRFDGKREESTVTPVAPKPKEPKVEPTEDESLTALQKQIADLKKSEELQRNAFQRANKEREEALKQVQRYQQDVLKQRQEALEGQELAIENAISAAKAMAEKARSDIRIAKEAGDSEAEIDAIERLATARGDLGNMERSKEEFAAQKKSLEEATKNPPQPAQQPEVPQYIHEWRANHPEYFSKRNKAAQLNWAWEESLAEGYDIYSKAQVDRIEELLGLKKPAPKPTEEDEETVVVEPTVEERRQASMVSAPVSREAPTGGRAETNPSKVKLTPAQKEAAAMAGITEVEYARQLLNLGKAKASGMYGESR